MIKKQKKNKPMQKMTKEIVYQKGKNKALTLNSKKK
jgi:hypothetical protein